ncbi:hypothetical protein ABW20_dc0109250 [Dactylellina cionopaga]|nr:hypothetical protein ABW20_dc0109250 [Dactylellina cionopaga]
MTYTLVNLYAFVYVGFGRNMYDLTIQQFDNCLKLYLVTFTTFAIANTAVKVSILILYQRIFNSMQTKMRTVIWIFIAVLVAFCPVSIAMQLVVCKPFDALWHIEWALDLNIKCSSSNTSNYVVGSIRAVFDVLIFILPLKHIWEIKNFSLRKKITITGIFTLGLVAVVASIVKLILYRQYLAGDVTRGVIQIVVAEEVEYTSAIVAACVPALLPLLKVVYRNTSSTIRQISSGKSQNQSTTTRITGGHPTANHSESIKMKGIKVSHVVSQAVEVQRREEDDTELILQLHDDHDDKDSKASYSRSQTSV